MSGPGGATEAQHTKACRKPQAPGAGDSQGDARPSDVEEISKALLEKRRWSGQEDDCF
jgi:hypothetical protein